MRRTAYGPAPLALQRHGSKTFGASEAPYDVVVIGAGVAGMVAAREFLQAGLSVKLLESSDRVGGRLHAVSATGGQALELGGEFFRLGTSPLLAAELRRYGIGTGTAYVGDQQLVFDEGRLHRLADVILERPNALKKLISTVREAVLRMNSTAVRAELEDTRVADALEQLMLPPLLGTWFRSWIEIYAGTSLDSISAASMLGLFDSAAGSLHSTPFVSGSRLVTSTSALTDGLRSSVANTLDFNRPARFVTRTDNGRGYVTRTASGTIRSHAVVIAAPRNVIADGRLHVDADWHGGTPRALLEPHPGLGSKAWLRLDEQAPPRTIILGRMAGFRSIFISDRLGDGSMWASLFGSQHTIGNAGTSLELAARMSVQQIWGGRVRVLEARFHHWSNDPDYSSAWTVTAARTGDPLSELHHRSPENLAFAGADFSTRRGGVEAALGSGFSAAAKILNRFGLTDIEERHA